MVSWSGAVRTRSVQMWSTGTPVSTATRSPPTLALIANPEPRAGVRRSISASSAQRRHRRRAPRWMEASAPPFGRIEESLSAAGIKASGMYRSVRSLARLFCLQALPKVMRVYPSGGDTPISCSLTHRNKSNAGS